MNSGIYKIVNKVNGKIYVGSTSNQFDNRWYEHKYGLNNNKHINNILQSAWNKYGEDNFEFIIIEEVEPIKEILIEREQYYIDILNLEYNICKVAGLGCRLGIKHSKETKKKISKNRKGITVGVNNPFYGRKHTEESLAKMKENHKNISGKNNPFYGKRHTDETKKKISISSSNPSEETRKKMSEAQIGEKNNNSKLTWEKVKKIRNEYIPYEFGIRKLASKYGVDEKTIFDVLHNNIWIEENI